MTSTFTELNMSVLEALDWEFQQPCEHSRHQQYHADQPAMFLVNVNYPNCQCEELPEDYFICLSGWEFLGRAKEIICSLCGTLQGKRDECLKIVSVIGS